MIDKKRTIINILSELNRKIFGNEEKFESIGIKYGIPGLCLYNFAYSSFIKSSAHLEKGNKLLQKSVELLNNDYFSQLLYNEMAELAWCVEICRETGFYEYDTNELLNDFDEILLGKMKEDIHEGNFDPAIGALSFGYYFLSRIPSSVSAKTIIVELCEALISLSHKNERGVYWKSKLMKDDSVYLGLSHGIAGVIVFLIKAGLAGIEFKNKEIISQAVHYLKSCIVEDKPVFFPVVEGKLNENDELYANNWCYGDPGTLYGLLVAAFYLNDKDLRFFCMEKFKLVTERDNGQTYLIAGYGLLYGYAGLCMLYNHCYKLTGETFFLKAYEKNLQKIIDGFNPEDEFLGYSGFWNQEIAVTNYSFAEGFIGISFLLMSHIEPAYDNFYKPLYYL